MRLPHAAGYLVAAETAALDRLARNIQRPYVVVLGGVKVADKLPVVGALLQDADLVLVGGAMAFTFLAAQGHPMGTSLTEPGLTDAVRGYLDLARCGGAQIVLPADVVVAASRSAGAARTVVPVTAIPPGQMGLDIGPKTARLFTTMLADARTVFWNGPMGVAELPRLRRRHHSGGPGDHRQRRLFGGRRRRHVAAVRALGFADSAFGYVSTGAGTSLEYLQGTPLPGLAVLQDRAASRA